MLCFEEEIHRIWEYLANNDNSNVMDYVRPPVFEEGEGGEYEGPFAVTVSDKLEVSINEGVAELGDELKSFIYTEEDLSSQITSTGRYYLYYRLYVATDSGVNIDYDIKVSLGSYPKREYVEIETDVERWIYPIVLADMLIADISDEGEDEDLQVEALVQLQYGSHQVAGVYS